jgi:hypothetical protein
MDGELWGDASVTFPDWMGTAQVDERRTVPWEGLGRTVGLDADEWQVVGFSVSEVISPSFSRCTYARIG